MMEARAKRIEEIARVIFATTYYNIDPDSKVCMGEPYRMIFGGYLVPSDDMTNPAWTIFLAAATKLVDEEIVRADR